MTNLPLPSTPGMSHFSRHAVGYATILVALDANLQSKLSTGLPHDGAGWIALLSSCIGVVGATVIAYRTVPIAST